MENNFFELRGVQLRFVHELVHGGYFCYFCGDGVPLILLMNFRRGVHSDFFFFLFLKTRKDNPLLTLYGAAAAMYT
jgi:hypothetical protein